MRASEAASLKVADIDSSRMVIRIEHGKGGRDQYVMLSPQLLGILRTYWRLARLTHWLFPGHDDDHAIGPTVRHAAGRSACAGSGLSNGSPCTRCATALPPIYWRAATDIRIIQALLGHSNLQTTARYTQVANSTIRGTASPLDRLRLEVTPPT